MQLHRRIQDNITPLHPFHIKAGAKFVPFAGYSMPVSYPSGILQEHEWVRTQAGLFDVSHMGVIRVTGDHAPYVLEKLIPGDLQEMEPGQVRYGVLLTPAGGIVDDLLLTRLENEWVLVVNAGCKHKDLAYIHSAEVTVLPDFHNAILALQGPQARKMLSTLFPEISSLTFMQAAQVSYQGTTVLITCSGYTGEDGFEMLVAAATAPSLVSSLLHHEAVQWIGLGARDSLRLEAGLSLYGQDIDETVTPVEAGLTFALGKRRRLQGGFEGAAVVLHHLSEGAPRKRIGLTLPPGAIPRQGMVVCYQETEVGVITSGSFSPTLKHPIALALVRADVSGEANFTVILRGEPHPATQVFLPFVAHHYYRG